MADIQFDRLLENVQKVNETHPLSGEIIGRVNRNLYYHKQYGELRDEKYDQYGHHAQPIYLKKGTLMSRPAGSDEDAEWDELGDQAFHTTSLPPEWIDIEEAGDPEDVEEDRQMSDQEGVDSAREGAAINAQSNIMDMPEEDEENEAEGIYQVVTEGDSPDLEQLFYDLFDAYYRATDEKGNEADPWRIAYKRFKNIS